MIIEPHVFMPDYIALQYQSGIGCDGAVYMSSALAAASMSRYALQKPDYYLTIPAKGINISFSTDKGNEMAENKAATFLLENKDAIRTALFMIADTTLSQAEKDRYDKLLQELEDVTKPKSSYILHPDDYQF